MTRNVTVKGSIERINGKPRYIRFGVGDEKGRPRRYPLPDGCSEAMAEGKKTWLFDSIAKGKLVVEPVRRIGPPSHLWPLAPLGGFSAPDHVVYAIQNESTGHIKIGRARVLGRRVAELQTSSPHRLRIVAYAPCGSKDVARWLEKEMHAELSAWRAIGEWFHPSTDVYDLVRSMLSIHWVTRAARVTPARVAIDEIRRRRRETL